MEKMERELACQKEDLASRLAAEVLFRLCPLNAETLTTVAILSPILKTIAREKPQAID